MKTRKPTGVAPWPITLVAGVEKSGKTYSCAEASASDLIGRTLWLSIGEDDPDEYAQIPGADFEIIEHDGSYLSILQAVQDATALPPTGGKPNLIVIDSMTRLWELCSNLAQQEANARARRKASGAKSPGGDEARIDMDLWNVAKGRHAKIINLLKAHAGPVLLTARMDKSTVMDDEGRPTKIKDFKIKAEKSLVYDVSVIVEMIARGESYLSGVRSLRFRGDPSERTRYPEFTVAKLWRDLGVSEGVGPRHFDGARFDDSLATTEAPQPAPEQAPQDWLGAIAAAADAPALEALWHRIKASGNADEYRGPVTARLAVLRGEIAEAETVDDETGEIAS